MVIDKATFERMLSGFEIFAEKVERLCREQEDLGEKEWLDSDDVCRLLCISPRTLQTMRENAGLYQNKPQGILQTGGCEVHLSRDGNETVYNSRQGKKMQCKQQTNQQANQQTNQQTDI